MTRAGYSDAEVLAYARAHRSELPPEVSDSDLRWLRDSGVSSRVILYMTAIDVRASDAGADAASGSYEDVPLPGLAYSNASNEGNYTGSYYGGYSDSYPDSYYDAYPGYGVGYGYGYYPYYPYYGYGYPVYFYVDSHGFYHRFHGGHSDGHHGSGGHHGPGDGHGSGGHHGNVAGPGGSRDAWRERGFSDRRASSSVVGPRGGSGRPSSTVARGSFSPRSQGPYGRVVSPRGIGPSNVASRSAPRVVRGPSGGASGHGGFSHPGFSSGPRAGGSFGGGSHPGSAPHAGRAR